MIKQDTKFYDENGQEVSIPDNASVSARGIATWYLKTPCRRCGGSGIYSSFHGACFRCQGMNSRSFEDTKMVARTEKALGKLIADRERRAKKRKEKAEEEARKSIEQFSEELKLIKAYRTKHEVELKEQFSASNFNGSIAKQLFVRLEDGTLEPQTDLSLTKNWVVRSEKVLKILSDNLDKEPKAPSKPVDIGRYLIEGKIIKIKRADDYEFSDKCAVDLGEGRAVYGTLPKAIGDAEVGDTVRFEAEVKQSDTNKSFGFYSRPTKASIAIPKDS